MAKKATKTETIVRALFKGKERDFIITEASIVDGLCNYTYEITKGIGSGNPHSVKGKHIIDDDMRNAFATFNVHLAMLDDAFKYSGIEVEDIDMEHGHELTGYFIATGFKIKGGKDNESIILLGNKYVSACGGRPEIKTAKIPLDHLSSYKFYNELKLAADITREEVALYEEGKYTIIPTEDETPDPAQISISYVKGDKEHDADFANAAL